MDPPHINLHQPPSHDPAYPSAQPSSAIPGALLPGPAVRPGPASIYSAPTVLASVPQINTNAQHYNPTGRSGATSAGHGYSRSSPAGLEQKFVPFSASTDPSDHGGKGNILTTQKYYSPQTPTGAISNSPLALADIRPRGSSVLDDLSALGPGVDELADRIPSNCNSVTPWAVFAFDWCKWPVHGNSSAGKIAVGSYLEDPHNFIHVLETHIVPQEINSPGAPPYGIEYSRVAEATCSYPVTRILWEPPSQQKSSTNLLATSGDHLRLWSLPPPTTPTSNTITRPASNTKEPPQKLTPLALLSNSKSPEHTAPLTSLDWNTLSPKLIITSSIDTTCTIWDIPTLTAKTQLIAHDKEVYDVRFCAGSVDVFVSCGADGSVRMFDLRSLEHSTIIYEPSERPTDKDSGSPGGRMSPTKAQQTMIYSPPLLQLAASPHDSHLLATFAADSTVIRVLDVRQPGQALLELRGHAAPVNCIEWSPSRRGMLASGGDDSLVMLWDLPSANGAALNGQGDRAAASASQIGTHGIPANPTTLSAPGGGGTGSSAAGGSGNTTGGGGGISARGPTAFWRSDYEVGNLSWAPQSHLTGHGGDWLGVSGGRSIWSVKA